MKHVDLASFNSEQICYIYLYNIESIKKRKALIACLAIELS
jgi:hypothetical protein